jgi:hypothetical protein
LSAIRVVSLPKQEDFLLYLILKQQKRWLSETYHMK